MSRGRPLIDEERCDGCMACVFSCPVDAYSLTFGEYLHINFDPGRCIYCGLCKEICPEKAIEYETTPSSPSFKSKQLKLVSLKTIKCSLCGRFVMTQREEHNLKRELSKLLTEDADTPYREEIILCERCKRERAAQKRLESRGWRVD